ncbi:MAG: HRDC domain-containing protein [Elusimicrobia bacterium]|nr:HRDC domain-containing protein [Elusimicrobiota bacterium]
MPTRHHPLEEIKPATVVTAREHLEEVVAELRQEPRIAIDTESNGFYAYQEKVCLVQISSAREDYIVDPIAVSDFSALGELTADPKIEKIFHAGEYDVLCLKRDYGFRFANLFDTMIAARLLGSKELGLAAAIRIHFGVTLSKKLQRADWGLRPLSEAHLKYAQLDTHYLLRLSELLKAQLCDKGREADAVEACAQLAELEPVFKSFDPEGFWRLSGRNRLTDRQMACLREIFLLRETRAQSLDRAPFRIMPEELMVRLAADMPDSPEALAKVKGMTPYLLRKFGGAFLEALERGRQAPPPVEPPRMSLRRSNKERRLFEALRLWRKGQAAREAVEPVVILDTSSLHELARASAAGEPDPLAGLSELKRQRYGEPLLKLVLPKA